MHAHVAQHGKAINMATQNVFIPVQVSIITAIVGVESGSSQMVYTPRLTTSMPDGM